MQNSSSASRFRVLTYVIAENTAQDELANLEKSLGNALLYRKENILNQQQILEQYPEFSNTIQCSEGPTPQQPQITKFAIEELEFSDEEIPQPQSSIPAEQTTVGSSNNAVAEEQKKDENVLTQEQQNLKAGKTFFERYSYWFTLSNFGQIVEGTNIIPGKTFLLKKRWNDLFKDRDDQRYRISDLINHFKEIKRPIKIIIDLSNTENYYSFDKCKRYYFKEYLKDVQYYHFPIDVDTPPRKNDINKICEVLKQNAFKQDFYIYIHCFSGLNRTGYVISYFLCNRLNISSAEALKRFEVARGHAIVKKSLLQDLQEKFDV